MAIANSSNLINSQELLEHSLNFNSIEEIKENILKCNNCLRLRNYCNNIAKNKIKRFIDREYKGLPVSGFGPENPNLVKQIIVGLAPSAHGANRTGRMISGDQSGKWLYEALYQTGECSHPGIDNEKPDLRLHHTYITCAVKCAPPDNKPTREEYLNCSDFLIEELRKYTEVKKFICLGSEATREFWKAYCKVYLNNSTQSACGYPKLKALKFKHNEKIITSLGHEIRMSYHPSQQNTFTGRLIWDEWMKVFRE